MFNNRRQSNRIASELPVEISIGSQVVIQGRLKDISIKGAFIRMKSSVFMQVNDEINFQIKCSSVDAVDTVSGAARISRITAGEGIAIYFTKLTEGSEPCLQRLVGGGPGTRG